MPASAFYQLAGKQVKELVKPYGFKKNGRFFYRITEAGVVQQFCLLWRQDWFRIRFYLSSIYGYNGRKIEGEEINEWINKSEKRFGNPESSCPIDSEKFVSSAAAACVQIVKDTLLPFMESHQDPHSARRFVAEYDPRVASGIDKYNIRELGFYLCLGDFASVQDYLTYYIENYSKYNPNWWKTVEQEYDQLLEAICTDDREYISGYLEKKKNATFAEYQWK